MKFPEKSRSENKDFIRALDWLETLFSMERNPLSIRAGEVYNLDFMTAFLDRLGNPQDSYPVIHIAGTNGKGSTAVLIDSILRELGLSTGMYLSPHILTIRERIQLDGEYISEQDFADLVLGLRDSIAGREMGIRTYFELMTASAMLFFQRKSVDVAILETGLGGRLDATNIANAGVAVITKIGLDHQKALGNTLKEILYEKLGIIKKGSAVVLQETSPELTEISKQYAEQAGAKSFVTDRSIKVLKEFNLIEDDAVRLSGLDFGAFDVKMGIRGLYQGDNLTTAALAVREFLKSERPDIELTGDALKNGAFNATIPGRLQKVSQKPLIFLDGGHNVDAVEGVMEYFDIAKDTKDRLRIVYAGMHDKDIGAVMQIFNRYSGIIERILLTELCNPRSATKGELAEYSKALKASRLVYDNSKDAFMDMRKDLPEGTIIVVMGSLYLVSEYLLEYGDTTS